MTGSDPFSDIVTGYLDLLRRSLTPSKITASSLSTALPTPELSRPCALLLSPHPDDECLTGALPLRLKREQGWRIINIAMTLGSDHGRREARKIELAQACAVLGFECMLPHEDGFSHLTPAARQEDLLGWQRMVSRLAEIIAFIRPRILFMPHAEDAHPTHIGTHLLGMDALATQAETFICSVIQSEYWHPLAKPNMMIGLSPDDTAALLSALVCHAGENARNPYDIRFPAYLIDNVRRGSERVAGQGSCAATMDFAMLYKFGIWRAGKYIPSALSRLMGDRDSLQEIINLN